MGSVFPVIPHPCEDNPQQPEGVPESGSGSAFLFDPSSTFSQLTFCSQKSCCDRSPGADQGHRNILR